MTEKADAFVLLSFFTQTSGPNAPIGVGTESVASASNAATRAEAGHDGDVQGVTRAAGSNQQVPDGLQTKQVKEGGEGSGRANAGLGNDASGQTGGAGGLK
ncbi:hypothetical protein OIV83_002326 [Microbotryomycetes sp. JL201]|nr:hypothetical protein OIV83_002326 [Microbotryomycetes sp. JL201]